jgi:hypothetical protein
MTIEIDDARKIDGFKLELNMRLEQTNVYNKEGNLVGITSHDIWLYKKEDDKK